MTNYRLSQFPSFTLFAYLSMFVTVLAVFPISFIKSGGDHGEEEDWTPPKKKENTLILK
jgi:hypothetical protein